MWHRSSTCLSVVSLLGALVWGQVQWVPKFNDALKQAQAEGKFIVIDISASWCPPSQDLVKKVYPDRDFIQFSRSQIFMLLDAEKDSEGIRLARRFDVHSFPTILVINQQGEEIHRLVGGATTKSLIQDLEQLFENPEPFEKLVKAAREDAASFDLQFKVGQRYLDRHDYSKARDHLEQALRVATDDNREERAKLMIMLAQARFHSGKHKESIQALDELVELEPALAGDFDLRLLRSRALLASRQYEEAGKILRDLLRATRSREDAVEVRRAVTQLPKKYRGEDKEYAKALEKARDNLRKGDGSAAMEMAIKAAELMPQASDVHTLLASIYFQNSKKAVDTLEQGRALSNGLNELRLARRLDPEDMLGYRSAKFYLAWRIMPESPTSADARKQFEEGSRLFVEENYTGAARSYTKTIELEPSFGRAYLSLGDCYFATGRLDEAIKWYQAAASHTPLDPAPYRFAADTLRKLERRDEARHHLVKALLADPEYPLVWKDLDEIARAEGRFVERHAEIVPVSFMLLGADAETYNEEIFTAVPPETAPSWREYVKQKLLWRQTLFQKAYPKESFYRATFAEELDCLEKLLARWDELRKENPSLRNESLDFLRQVNLDGLLEAFIYLELFTEEYRVDYEQWKTRNLKVAQTYIDTYLLGAPQARSRGEYNSSAIEAFNAALQRYRDGDKPGAVESYNKALLQEPRMKPALQNLALLYMELDNLEAAESVTKEWAYVEPQSGQLHEALSHLQYRKGDYESARDHLEQAISLETDPVKKERMAGSLASLEEYLSQVPRAARIQAGNKPAAADLTRPTIRRQADTESDVAARAPRQDAGIEKALEQAGDALSNKDAYVAISILEDTLPKIRNLQEKQQAMLMLAAAYFEVKQWKESRRYLTEFLRGDPNDPSARELLKELNKITPNN